MTRLEQLDAISRIRALTDAESLQLERIITRAGKARVVRTEEERREYHRQYIKTYKRGRRSA